MAHKTKTLAHLRNSTRGAAVVEYITLLALIGGISVGAVLALGTTIERNAEETHTRVDEIVALSNRGTTPGDGGSGGPGGGGPVVVPSTPTPPVNVFASCESGFGPNPAAVRLEGASYLGSADRQMIYATPNGSIDGGEGGDDFDTLMVPGVGAVAVFTSWWEQESGRIDFPNGDVLNFSNVERVVLCDGGGQPPPPADPFASCEAIFGPNAAAIRLRNGAYVGGTNRQTIYALANSTVDGGEGGDDLDTLMIPGVGAVATFTSWAQPESGRVDLADGGVITFTNTERVVLCDQGGMALPPAPPTPVLLADVFPLTGAWMPASNNLGTPSSGYYFNYTASGNPLRSADGVNRDRANAGDVLGSETVFAVRSGSVEYRTGTINQTNTASVPALLFYTVERPSSVFVVPTPSTTAQRTAVSNGSVWSVYMLQSGWTRPTVAPAAPFLSSDIRTNPGVVSVYDCGGTEILRPKGQSFTTCPIP